MIHIEWDGKKATADTQEGLLKCFRLYEKWQKAEGAPDDFESVMKGLGMCIWSWPVREDFAEAYRICQMSASGQNIQMPYPSLSFDEQPNLFFEYLTVFFKAKSDYEERNGGPNK